MNMEFINTQENFCTLLNDLLTRAKKSGADSAEASVYENSSMEVSVRCAALDNMSINREQGASLTVYVNGKSGSATSSNTTPATLQTLVERALAIARATSSDPHAGLADAALMATDFPDLAQYHPWQITPEDAIAIAKESEEASWTTDPTIQRKKSDGASVSTSRTLSAYGNTHGFTASEKVSSHNISCSAIAEKDGMMETNGWSETRRNAEWLPSAQTIGEIAGKHAARRLGGKKISDCRAAVLFQAPTAHSLIGHFVGAASGGSLFRKSSFLLNKLESAVFAPHINIRERPYLAGEMASGSYDDDGVAPQDRDIVKNGIWQGRFLSAYSARKLGATSTGNAGGIHNLEVTGDTVAAATLPALMQRGLIVTDLMGQGANMLTGDYSRGVAGFWVENGEIAYPVSEVTIAGNLLNMLPAVRTFGDDVMRRGAISCGSLLIPEMIIGGN